VQKEEKKKNKKNEMKFRPFLPSLPASTPISFLLIKGAAHLDSFALLTPSLVFSSGYVPFGTRSPRGGLHRYEKKNRKKKHRKKGINSAHCRI
jgi:hypothetical protein